MKSQDEAELKFITQSRAEHKVSPQLTFVKIIHNNVQRHSLYNKFESLMADTRDKTRTICIDFLKKWL